MPRVCTATLNPTIDVAYRVDHLAPEVKLRCRDGHETPGGGGINVARMAHRLGAETLALWSRGGPRAQRLEALLADEGLPQQGVAIPGDIRESFMVRVADEERAYRFVTPGPELDERDLQRWETAVAEQVGAQDCFVVSGSLPPGLPEESCARLLRALPADARAVVDASGAALQAAVAAEPWLIKPNREELADLVGSELEDVAAVRTAAADVHAQGVAVVVVSLGSDGAVVVADGLAEHCPAPSVAEARNPSGAGDSMVGGLVAALVRGEEVPTAVRYGMAAGAAAVSSTGTGLASAAAVDERYARM